MTIDQDILELDGIRFYTHQSMDAYIRMKDRDAGALRFSNFRFRIFTVDSRWSGRDDIRCSLLGSGACPDPREASLDHISESIICTTGMRGLYEIGFHRSNSDATRSLGADDVVFAKVDAGVKVFGILIHDEEHPIAYIGFAFGLPLTGNGGVVEVKWDRDPLRIMAL